MTMMITLLCNTGLLGLGLLGGIPAALGQTVPNMPVPLGEVAAGKIGDKVYLVGEDDDDNDGPTLEYDITLNEW